MIFQNNHLLIISFPSKMTTLGVPIFRPISISHLEPWLHIQSTDLVLGRKACGLICVCYLKMGYTMLYHENAISIGKMMINSWVPHFQTNPYVQQDMLLCDASATFSDDAIRISLNRAIQPRQAPHLRLRNFFFGCGATSLSESSPPSASEKSSSSSS